MEISFEVSKALSILTEFVFGRDVFFRKLRSLASETLVVVKKAKASSELDCIILRELKVKWDDISSSKRFFRPGGKASRITNDCLFISTDIAILLDRPENPTNRECLEDMDFLLNRLIKDTELLVHGDPVKLLRPAIERTKRYLKEYHSCSSDYGRNGKSSIFEREGSLAKKIRHDQSSVVPNNKDDPRDLWDRIRRKSRYTNQAIYHDSSKILRLLDRVICTQQRKVLRQLPHQNDRHPNESPDVDALNKEISRVSRYIWLNRRKKAILIQRIILTLFGFSILLIVFGLFTSRMIKLSSALSNPVKASEGEKILAPIDYEGRDERMDNPACVLKHELKTRAVNSFPKDPENAKSLMLQYLAFCPSDAEAQVYLNNYDVVLNQRIRNDSRPTIRLAVVVPLLRSNGIRDSFEILRGIALAQYKANNSRNENTQQKPLILVMILNDGTKTNNEDAKGVMAQRVAETIVSDRTTQHSRYPLIGVIGHFSSGTTEAASKIYYVHNIPVISPTSTNRREPLDSFRYKLNGVTILHGLLDHLHSEPFAQTLSSYYLEYLTFLNHFVFDNISRLRTGHLDLDPSIYRMPPTDDKAQTRLLEYLEEYNRDTQDSGRHVHEIVVVWEERRVSKYSDNYMTALQETAATKSFDKVTYVNCRFNPDKASIDTYKTCVTDALGNSNETKALLLVPSSSNVIDVLKNVKQIIKDSLDKKNIIVLGADSLMSAFSYSSSQSADPIYDGIVVSAPTDNSEESYLVQENNKDNFRMVLTWRSHMAFDSVIFFQEIAAKALKHHRPSDLRRLRSYVLNNFTTPIQSEFSNGEQVVQFDPVTHDRKIDEENKRINILLCKSSSTHSKRLFKPIIFTPWNDICK